MDPTQKGTLYLLPVPLGQEAPTSSIPETIKGTVGQLSLFFVEHPRSARRTLIALGEKERLNHLEFLTTQSSEMREMIHLLDEGRSAGLLPESGAPGVADPGASLVLHAHEAGIPVVPLPGPSSILLALMGSGLNGQSFAFHGYLPRTKRERQKRIHQLDRSANAGTTQIFMETPYRNDALMADLMEHCAPHTFLGIASDLTLSGEFVATRPISEWKEHLPSLHKRQTVFLLGTSSEDQK